MEKDDQLSPEPSQHHDHNAVENDEPKEAASQTPDNAATSSSDDYEYLTGIKLVLVIATATMAPFLVLLDSSIVATAIPRITSDFHSIADIGWYPSAYLLSNCSLQPLAGKLYTQFSSKIVFFTYLGIFELGSLVSALATSSNMLIVGRAIAGIGGSGIMNGALIIITASVPLKKRPPLIGFLSSIAQVGNLCGPVIGGALTQYVSWRWCFYINLPIGASVAALLMAIHIPDRVVRTTEKPTFRQSFEKLDILGASLFASTIVMFLLALQWGGHTYPWSSGTVIGLFVGAFVELCVFLAWEHHRGDTAMIPLTMLRKMVVLSSCLTMLFQLGNIIVTAYYLPLWFQVIKDATPSLSGVYLLPMILPQMAFAIISGLLVGRLGYYLPFSLANGVLASIGCGLLTMFKTNTSTAMWVGVQLILGVGRGCGIQMPLVAVQNALPAAQAAIGTTLIVFCQYFGGALFSSIAEAIFLESLKDFLRSFAPEVSPQTVISAGATGLRAVISKASLPGVILAYNESISHVFYLAVAACIAMFFSCLGMGWKNIKGPKPAPSGG